MKYTQTEEFLQDQLVLQEELLQKTLLLTNITGTLLYTSGSESIKGASSGAEYLITSDGTSDIVIPVNTNTNDIFGDNQNIEIEGNIIDFSDTDPFSEGKF